MIKVITLAILSLSTMGFAATVSSAPLEKAAFDSKKALFITNEGAYACPANFDLYVRALAPPKKDDKTAPPQGDFESFYFAKSAQGGVPAIIVSRPGIQEYVAACFQVK